MLSDIIKKFDELEARYRNSAIGTYEANKSNDGAISDEDNSSELIPYIVKSDAETSYKAERLIGTKAVVYNNIPYITIMVPKKDNVKVIANDLKVNVMWKARKYQLNPVRYHGTEAIENTLPFFPETEIVRRIEEQRWNLYNIQSYIAWQYSKGRDIRIGIIDTGVDYFHDELRERFRDDIGYNFIRGNHDPYDDNSHGTHVAGIIAGKTTGVAPQATLYALKVLNANGSGSEHHVLQAIDWSISNGMDIINMSLGSSYYSPAEKEICKVAYDRGISIVAAAGNDGEPLYNYPASLPGVISVAAVDRFNNHAYFSNINDMVDISAPGVNIYSSIPDNKYAIYSGTSMATPHVSGALAIIKSYTKHNNKDLEEEMKRHSKYLGDELKYGAGIVQVYDTLRG